MPEMSPTKDAPGATLSSLRRALPDTPRVCAFLSGSVAEGFASPSADYDVYLVVDVDRDLGTEEKFSWDEQGLIETTTLPLRVVENIALKIQKAQRQANSANSNDVPTPYELLLAHRICTGIALDNASKFRQLKQRVNARSLASYLCAQRAIFANKAMSDAYGNLEARDYDSAMFNAHGSAVVALDMLLSANGCTSIVTKWRSRNAKAFLGEKSWFWTEFLELASLPSTQGPPEKMRYVERAAVYLQRASDVVVGISRFPGLQRSAMVVASRPARQIKAVDQRHIVRSPHARVIERDELLYLVVKKPLFEVSARVLGLWLRLRDGITLDELKVEATKKRNGLPPLDVAFIDRTLPTLIKAGAISVQG